MIGDDEPEKYQRPPDMAVESAKKAILEEIILPDGKDVFYSRQIMIALEGRFFHWNTTMALNELVAERKLSFSDERLELHLAHFYYDKKHRYPRRQIRETISLIAEFSHPTFTRALGRHGELLFDAGLSSIGFRIIGRNLNMVSGVLWEKTGHDLDRLIERDGVLYGVEIKNQLAYISQDEFDVKLSMCEYFGIKPFFVARMMPKTYIYEVQQRGGFCLILKNQHYPLLADDLARRVGKTLGLPIALISELPDTTMVRFERWHERQTGV